MITRVVLQRFKRFDTLDLDLPGHVVLAGPNNGGKTTVLQAISAWSLALRRWRELNSRARPQGAFPYAYISRPDFLAVPLPQNGMDLLWCDKQTDEPVVIGLVSSDGWQIAMELRFDEEQVRVRPAASTDPAALRRSVLDTVYIPPMSGLVPQEPLYGDDATLEARLAEGRPGEILRNLLYKASRSEEAWERLSGAVRRLFGYTLEGPATGKYLTAEYRKTPNGPRFDIASAGSGFQQVVMLLTFLVVRRGSVLLVDEPDAHLHVILQDAIFHELHEFAAHQHSQLILSTHSEVVINSVEASEVVVMPGGVKLRDREAQRVLIRGLGIISNTDLMLAGQARGILYLEGSTDLAILRDFAEVLGHPARQALTRELFWHRYSDQTREGAPGFSSRQHFEALRLFHPSIRALEIQDRDGNPNLPETSVAGIGHQVLRWRRYEVESYLLHADVLGRFVVDQIGQAAHDSPHLDALRAKMAELLTQEFVDDPAHPKRPAEAVLESDKARTVLLPPILDAAGLPAFPYTRYHEIVRHFRSEEVHPEVKAKLDAICVAFGIPLDGDDVNAGERS